MLSDEIIKEFASGILISDVASYINNHQKEYQEWLITQEKEKKKKSKKQKNKERSMENAIYTTKKG